MKNGFTMIEILVVIAIFSVLITIGLFMSMETLRGTHNRSEQEIIVSLLQKARSRAMNNIDQTQWGVCDLPPNYVIFKGTLCRNDMTVDVVSANPGVTTHGLTYGIVFSQLAGTTTPATITTAQNGKFSTTTINYEGTIIW